MRVGGSAGGIAPSCTSEDSLSLSDASSDRLSAKAVRSKRPGEAPPKPPGARADDPKLPKQAAPVPPTHTSPRLLPSLSLLAQHLLILSL